MSDEDLLSKHQRVLLEWSGEATYLIADFFYEMAPNLACQNSKVVPEDFVLWQLNESCHLSAESVLLLVGNMKLWDADSLMRSVMEGTIKFIYLTGGTENERTEKLREFDDSISAFGRLKRHQRLEELLKIVGNPNDEVWRSYRDLLLSQPELESLRNKYPRKIRQQIEQRWSFSEICSQISKSQGGIFKLMTHLMFCYGMSSHIIHQDIDGIGMVWDRNRRDDTRRQAIEWAHGSRLINDVVLMSLLRAVALSQMKQIPKEKLNPLVERLGALADKTKQAEKNFHKVEYGDTKVEEKPV